MIISRDEFFVSDRPAAVALGTFDGLHLGHIKVIQTAVDYARTCGMLSAVFTFDSLPRNAFLPADKQIPAICSIDEKLRLMRGMGVDVAVCPPFSVELRERSAEDFVENILIRDLKARHIVCGDGHHFGAGGRGDTALLKSICRVSGVEVTVLPPVMLDGARISSTRVRDALANGDVAAANALLGREYSVRFPISEGTLLPPCGSYIAVLTCEKAHARSIVSIDSDRRVNFEPCFPYQSFSIGFCRQAE